MTHLVAFAFGGLVGAALAINACASLEDRLGAFFEAADSSLVELEDAA